MFTDMSSIIVEWAMTEMLKNPSIMARAQKELDRMVSRRLEESDLPGPRNIGKTHIVPVENPVVLSFWY